MLFAPSAGQFLWLASGIVHVSSSTLHVAQQAVWTRWADCHCRLSRCALDPHCLSPLTALHLGPISVRCWTRCWLAYINMYRGVSKYQIHMLPHNCRTFHSEVKVRLWLGLLRLTYKGYTKDSFTATHLDSCRHLPVPPRKAENSSTDFNQIWHWWGGGLLKFFQYPPVVCQNRTITTAFHGHLRASSAYAKCLFWTERSLDVHDYRVPGFCPSSVTAKNKVSYTRFCPRKDTSSFGGPSFFNTRRWVMHSHPNAVEMTRGHHVFHTCWLFSRYRPLCCAVYISSCVHCTTGVNSCICFGITDILVSGEQCRATAEGCFTTCAGMARCDDTDCAVDVIVGVMN